MSFWKTLVEPQGVWPRNLTHFWLIDVIIETLIWSLEIFIWSLKTLIWSLETCISRFETCIWSLETFIVSLETFILSLSHQTITSILEPAAFPPARAAGARSAPVVSAASPPSRGSDSSFRECPRRPRVRASCANVRGQHTLGSKWASREKSFQK